MANSPHRWMMIGPDKPLVKTEFDPFPPAEGQVVVEVAGCGVCHTDLGFYYDGVRTKAPLPVTLGHEISGRVVATGAGAEAWQGKAVIISAAASCGECDLCTSGYSIICQRQMMLGNDLHGGFATHVLAPAKTLCFVDEKRLAAAGLTLPDVSVVADAMATPYNSVLQADIKPGDFAVVIGVGGVGGYAVQIARAFGATVVALDVDSQKLSAMAEHGASLTVNVREVQGRDLKKTIQEFAKKNGFPGNRWKIFECSGTAAGQDTAFSLLNFAGTMVVVGFTMDKVELRISNLMALHARMLGNWGCETERYPAVLDMVLDGKISLLPFVEQLPLSEINQIFEATRAHKLTRRSILVPGR